MIAMMATTIVMLTTQEPVNDPARVTSVRWLEMPSPAAIADLYPAFANLIEESGRVALRCQTLDVNGPPQECQAVMTEPEGLGFAEAAIKVASTGVVQPATVDGVAQSTTMRFNLNFAFHENEPVDQTRYEGPEPDAAALDLARLIVETTRERAGGRLGPTLDHELLIASVADDRKALVRQWLEELYSFDDVDFEQRSQLALARLYSSDQLRSALLTGQPLPEPDPWAWAIAMGLAERDRLARAELRRRYCERFECG